MIIYMYMYIVCACGNDCVCVCITLHNTCHMQGTQHPEPSTVYVDQRALRVDRVSVLERGAPNSVCLQECGKVLPDVRVAIVHPDTKAMCAHTDLGEVRESHSLYVYIIHTAPLSSFLESSDLGVQSTQCQWLLRPAR